MSSVTPAVNATGVPSGSSLALSSLERAQALPDRGDRRTDLLGEASCQTCDFLSWTLQRAVKCERHAAPGRVSGQRPTEPQPTEASGPVNVDAPGPFSTQELLRLQLMRSRLREHLQDGLRPDDLPANAWRTQES